MTDIYVQPVETTGFTVEVYVLDPAARPEAVRAAVDALLDVAVNGHGTISAQGHISVSLSGGIVTATFRPRPYFADRTREKSRNGIGWKPTSPEGAGRNEAVS